MESLRNQNLLMTTTDTDTDTNNNDQSQTNKLVFNLEAVNLLQNFETNENPDTIDVENHYSKDFIDSMYDSLLTFEEKFLQFEEDKKDNPNLQFKWRAKSITYPENCKDNSKKNRRNFRNNFESEKFKFEPNYKVLLYEKKIRKNEEISGKKYLVVPEQKYLKAIWRYIHCDQGHHGINAMEDMLRNLYYIRSGRKWIIERKNVCKCKLNSRKPKKTIIGKGALKIPTLPIAPMELVHFDLSGEYAES